MNFGYGPVPLTLVTSRTTAGQRMRLKAYIRSELRPGLGPALLMHRSCTRDCCDTTPVDNDEIGNAYEVNEATTCCRLLHVLNRT